MAVLVRPLAGCLGVVDGGSEVGIAPLPPGWMTMNPGLLSGSTGTAPLPPGWMTKFFSSAFGGCAGATFSAQSEKGRAKSTRVEPVGPTVRSWPRPSG